MTSFQQTLTVGHALEIARLQVPDQEREGKGGQRGTKASGTFLSSPFFSSQKRYLPPFSPLVIRTGSTHIAYYAVIRPSDRGSTDGKGIFRSQEYRKAESLTCGHSEWPQRDVRTGSTISRTTCKRNQSKRPKARRHIGPSSRQAHSSGRHFRVQTLGSSANPPKRLWAYRRPLGIWHTPLADDSCIPALTDSSREPQPAPRPNLVNGAQPQRRCVRAAI